MGREVVVEYTLILKSILCTVAGSVTADWLACLWNKWGPSMLISAPRLTPTIQNYMKRVINGNIYTSGFIPNQK